MLLKDKIAIVTGAGSGIGAASALRFAAEGAAVVAADIRLRKAQETVDAIVAAGGHATAVEVDVADAASVSAMVDAATATYGGLDVLFNNAGTLRPGSAVDLSVEDWDLVMGVNVRSVFLGVKYAVPVMAAHGGPVSWWRVVRADGSLPPSHQDEARQTYLEEGTPLRPSGNVDLRRAFFRPSAPA